MEKEQQLITQTQKNGGSRKNLSGNFSPSEEDKDRNRKPTEKSEKNAEAKYGGKSGWGVGKT